MMPAPPREKVWVARTWDRDGSVNLMDIEVAVANLVHNTEKVTSLDVRAALLRGDVLRTKRAAFRIRGMRFE
jgi:hypothetical protein